MSRRTNPFEELERIMNRMSQQIESDVGSMSGGMGGSAMDVEDRGTEFVVTVDLPGYDKEDITVELVDDRLDVSAQKGQQSESEEEGRYLRQERRESVERSVSLPESVDEDGVEANYQNGVLTVTLPKESEGAGGHRIDIE